MASAVIRTIGGILRYEELLIIAGRIDIPQDMISGHGDAAVMLGVVTNEGPAAVLFGMLQDRFPPGGGEEDGIALAALVFGKEDAMDIPAVFRFESLYKEDVFLRCDEGHVGEADEVTLTGGDGDAGLDGSRHALFVMGVVDDAGGEVAEGGGGFGGLVTGHNNELCDAGRQDMLGRDDG